MRFGFLTFSQISPAWMCVLMHAVAAQQLLEHHHAVPTRYPVTLASSRHGVGLTQLRSRVRFRAGAPACGYTRLRRISTSVVSRAFPMTFGSRCGVGLLLQSPWRPHTNIGVRGPTLVGPMPVISLCGTKLAHASHAPMRPMGPMRPMCGISLCGPH